MLPHALWKYKESSWRTMQRLSQKLLLRGPLVSASLPGFRDAAGPALKLVSTGGEGAPAEFTGTLPAQGQPKERWLLFWDEEGKGLPPGSGTQEQSLKAPQSRRLVLAYSFPGSPYDPTQKNKKQQDNHSVPACTLTWLECSHPAHSHSWHHQSLQCSCPAHSHSWHQSSSPLSTLTCPKVTMGSFFQEKKKVLGCDP